MDTKTTTEKTDEGADAPGTAEETAAVALDKQDTEPATAPIDADADAAGDEAGDTDRDDEDRDDEDEESAAEAAPAPAGIGGAAAAVVSAALGAVALTGTWTGKVVSERETLLGQIKTSGTGTPAQQISEIYGDAWHSTALVNGVFALIALLVAVLVLVLPGRPAWVRAVAVAGAVLGGLGLLLSVGTYFDLFLSLPTAGS
ncbi:hypothetical protein DEJ44_24860 [Streptomyces venezuelae]|uniref:hypothetical protein n=1 Tax=Streptomyces venezuelae TaxID=54571 RepID=UPI001239A5E6|nr:hypothetical protein [Streptomyces venezuelae]QES08530.1 hypothetical protein DEJ44_24860 [Streptomyces venezuelae]